MGKILRRANIKKRWRNLLSRFAELRGITHSEKKNIFEDNTEREIIHKNVLSMFININSMETAAVNRTRYDN